MKTLVTGGAGYVGAHACVELLARGHEVVVVDSLVTGDPGALTGVAAIAGVQPGFVHGDVRDQALMARVMKEHAIDAVLHFAALKDVGESCRQPLDYFDNNVHGMTSLLRAMRQAGVHRIVFSSSAAVYGDAIALPVAESAPTRAASPYGRSKLMCEQILADVAAATPGFSAAILRYFNPVGAHPSGLIGERADPAACSLMACIAQVAGGQRERLTVFGGDYPTPDGTGIRDYVHVVDVAGAHVNALDHLAAGRGGITANLGTGRGVSVLEVVGAFERASGRSIPVRFAQRRPGDVAASYADPARANAVLGWQARLGIERMCEDAWRRQQHLLAAGGGDARGDNVEPATMAGA